MTVTAASSDGLNIAVRDSRKMSTSWLLISGHHESPGTRGFAGPMRHTRATTRSSRNTLLALVAAGMPMPMGRDRTSLLGFAVPSRDQRGELRETVFDRLELSLERGQLKWHRTP